MTNDCYRYATIHETDRGDTRERRNNADETEPILSSINNIFSFSNNAGRGLETVSRTFQGSSRASAAGGGFL